MNSLEIKELKIHPDNLPELPESEFDVILLNTNFDIKEIYNIDIIENAIITKIQNKLKNMLQSCFSSLKNGGLLFIYGIPKHLILYGELLNVIHDEKSKMLFKYWIGLDINDNPKNETLKPTHMGLLMYLKTRNTKTTSPFNLNTKIVRIPYENCEHCNRNLKDWGGKKHWMNPLGACPSDVWKDLPKIKISNYHIPEPVKKRIIELTKFSENKRFKFLSLVEEEDIFYKNLQIYKETGKKKSLIKEKTVIKEFSEKNIIIQEDCISYLKELHEKYPSGIFDLFFADPPYNLEKDYSNYSDDQKEREYISWCKEWLKYGIKCLKPGGALLILNLPKWSIYFGKYLLKYLNFRHWIVWDAMSTPAGKIMPAHYSLLYFTKPGAPITFNYESRDANDLLSPLDSNVYCLRQSCIKGRKKTGFDEKIPLTDIWWDIHRIKHRKDRDYHPCQLPLKLMTRIISLTTNPGDLVFDPLSGAGTTSVAAKILKRNFISTEIDENYVLISRNNLRNIKELNNKRFLERKSIKKEKIIMPKKKIELKFIQLCKVKKKILTQKELKDLDPYFINDINKYYPSFELLKKRAKRIIEMNKSVNQEDKNIKEITDFF